MSVKKIDFVDLLVQFFSFVLGVLVVILFVPGMLIPVHAEETDGFIAPDGKSYTYKYVFTADFLNDLWGIDAYDHEVYSNYEIVAYKTTLTEENEVQDGYLFLSLDSSDSYSTRGHVYVKRTVRKTDGTISNIYYENDLSGYGQKSITKGGGLNMKIFDSVDSALGYCHNGDESGWLNPPPIDLEANGSLDENMPIPHITLHSHNSVDVSVSSSVSKNCHYVDNAADGYYIEVRGKWLSASDIELYRENLMWKSRVESVVSGELSTWISANDKFQSDMHFDFTDIENAVTAKNQLFADYPIESRNFYGGNNSIGDALTGKNAFIQDIKDFAIYGKPYTSPEFYVRFWYKDDNGYHYSKWTHFYEGFGSEFNQEEVPLQSDKGLTNDDLASVENGYSHTDPDLMPYDPGSGFDASMDSALSSFSETLKKFSDVSSGVTGMFVSIFSFLPWWSTAILGFAIVAVVILRFVGR